MEETVKNDPDSFSRQVAIKEKRKLQTITKDKQSVWSGLGVFGIVGWSVVVPTLLGAALGVWLDGKYPQSFSWTLTLLIGGLAFGCLIAWKWVDKEDKSMHQ